MTRSTPSKIDPALLGELQYEQTFAQTIGTSRRQVKIEKGHAWRVRYLPAKLGPKGTFFARISKHWLGQGTPIVCPRQTSPSFGGDPDGVCRACDVSAELQESANQAESQLGFDCRGNPQWLVYCLVFEKDGLEQPMSEVLVPYEHWMWKGVWEELKAFYMAGGSKSPNSVLDYVLGNDFVVSRTVKGYKLDKQDAQPIFERDPKYAEWLKKIGEQLKNPRVQIPTLEQVEAFALKIEEQSAKLHGVRLPRRGQSSAGVEESDDTHPAAEYEEPELAPRRLTPVPAGRRPAPVEPEPAPEAQAEGDQIPGAEIPARTPARPLARPPAAAPRPAASAPPVPAAPARSVASARPVAAMPAAPRRPAPAALPPEPAAEAELGEPAGEVAEPEPQPEPETPKAPAAAPRRAAPAQPEAGEEDENLPPDEATDQAPPAPMQDETAEPPAAPPPVGRRGPVLGTAIASRINALKARGM